MDKVPLVFDNGSGMTKAGFANEQDAPSVVFPSIVGRRKRHFGVMGQKDVYVGDEAIERSHMLKLNRPIEKGCVVNWGDMEELWRHTFNDELHVAPEEQPVLLTEAVLVKLSTQEKIQTMFEKFNVPATYVALSAVLSLIASGSETGIVIDSGEGVTQVVPVFEGHVAPYAVGRMYLAGGDITEKLRKTLTERGYLFRKDNDGIEDVRDIKETLAYMALHYDEELRSARDSSSIENNYQLPDGQTITIGSERFRCAELFYQPHIIGMEPTGIHKVVEESISHHTPRAKKALYENILLSGGSTMFPGFADRLKKEIAALVPNTMNVNVVAPPERKYSTWVGGAIFASMSSTKEKWITKSEYEEHGPSIVDKKCNYRLNGGFFIDHHVK